MARTLLQPRRRFPTLQSVVPLRAVAHDGIGDNVMDDLCGDVNQQHFAVHNYELVAPGRWRQFPRKRFRQWPHLPGDAGRQGFATPQIFGDARRQAARFALPTVSVLVTMPMTAVTRFPIMVFVAAVIFIIVTPIPAGVLFLLLVLVTFVGVFANLFNRPQLIRMPQEILVDGFALSSAECRVDNRLSGARVPVAAIGVSGSCNARHTQQG